MVRKLGQALLLLLVVGLLAGSGFANQITLSNSSTGQVMFTGTSTGATVDFTGSGHSLNGTGLFGPNLGAYSVWLSGGTLDLASALPGTDIYPIIAGSTIVNFSFVLNGGLGSVTGTMNLTDLVGGSTRAPEFIGTFTPSSNGTGLLSGFTQGSMSEADFTVNLGRNSLTVTQIFASVGQSTGGPVSSGEIFPTPEPATLGLLGSGLLTVAGLLKRRLT